VAAAIAAALLYGIVGAPSATGTDPDTTPPVIASMTVTPGHADVTNADAVFNVTMRVTDEASEILAANMSWSGAEAGGGMVDLTKAAGTDRDGMWTGSFTVPRYSAPGRYPLYVLVIDTAGNKRKYTADVLAAAGLPSFVEIADDNPDRTAPTVENVTISPDPVDVREGPAPVTFEIAAQDNLSGVNKVSAFLINPAAGNGGVWPPPFTLVEGTTTDGVWRATATIPRYSRQGRWVIIIYVTDKVSLTTYRVSSTTTHPTSFEVLSEEDVEGPRFASVEIDKAELDVHEEHQRVNVRTRVTDDLAGVGTWGGQFHISFHLEGLPSSWIGGYGMRRVSGDARDGIYEGSALLPKDSPTGMGRVRLRAHDRVTNFRDISGDALVAVGGLRSILVYNTPLAPTGVSASPSDGSVTVRWNAADERGAAVTEYVVRSSPGGAVVRVPGDARQAVVNGLSNGTAYSFTVAAVNKAGESALSAPVGTTPARTRRSGYWMVGSTGDVYAFGDARAMGNAPVGATPAVDIEATPNNDGYWIVDAAGRVFAFGTARSHGNAGGLSAGEQVTSLSATPDGGGYWIFTNRGRVLRFGNAPFLGDMSAAALNGPVLDSVATPSGKGYYMVASDGGVFAFGDARFAGSMASTRLNAPVQSLVPDPDGSGYWLVASDGGIFAFNAPFHGSMGSSRLNRPVTGMVGSSTGGGYLMVAEDGGIFAFGDVAFRGSLGSSPPAAPVTAVAAAR
jgi:hypothetical protein